MDKHLNKKPDAAVGSPAGRNERSVYKKPKLERLGRVVDFTGGLSLPALESGDPENRHF
jgi:hypothetical protein